MLVHFPIALILWGFIAEVASVFFKKELYLSKIGLYLLFIGTLSLFTAAISGVLFTSEMSGAAGEIKKTHEQLAWITIGITTIASIFRIYLETQNKDNANSKSIALALYGLAALSVSLTGFYGGTLVYNYMMPL